MPEDEEACSDACLDEDESDDVPLRKLPAVIDEAVKERSFTGSPARRRNVSIAFSPSATPLMPSDLTYSAIPRFTLRTLIAVFTNGMACPPMSSLTSRKTANPMDPRRNTALMMLLGSSPKTGKAENRMANT